MIKVTSAMLIQNVNKVDGTKPLKIGNMGDISGSHLADYFCKLTKLRFATQCGYRNIPEKSGMNLTLALVGSIARPSMNNKNTVLLGVGTIASNRLDGAILRNDLHVLGVSGPRSRDAFLAKFGINPEVVGDPGVYLYTILKNKVDEVRKNVKGMRDLCFISHEVEVSEFRSIIPEHRNVTMSAGGALEDIVSKMARCRHMVSSSLHGVIFSHSLSIPAIPIQVSKKLMGGEWKFFDYFYGMNVTRFQGRMFISKSRESPRSKTEWIDLIKAFPQPQFPINIEGLRTFRIFKDLFTNDGRSFDD